jgi:hypothetical protein
MGTRASLEEKMIVHKQMIAQVLRTLGHPVPSDDELSDALQKAFVEIKKQEGVDPDAVKYKLSLTEVDEDWVKKTFGNP